MGWRDRVAEAEDVDAEYCLTTIEEVLHYNSDWAQLCLSNGFGSGTGCVIWVQEMKSTRLKPGDLVLTKGAILDCRGVVLAAELIIPEFWPGRDWFLKLRGTCGQISIRRPNILKLSPFPESIGLQDLRQGRITVLDRR